VNGNALEAAVLENGSLCVDMDKNGFIKGDMGENTILKVYLIEDAFFKRGIGKRGIGKIGVLDHGTCEIGYPVQTGQG
jgi:hypothetical protein